MLLCLPCVGIYNRYCLQTLVKSSVQDIAQELPMYMKKLEPSSFLCIAFTHFMLDVQIVRLRQKVLTPLQKQ